MLHSALDTKLPKGTPRRAAGSSSAFPWRSLCATILLAFTSRVGAQAPTAAQLDSLRQRVEDTEAALATLREQIATEAGSAFRTRSRVAVEFSGRALMNVFSNTSRTNNVDVPVFARPDSGTGPQGGLAMSIRQTKLAMAISVADIAGGTFSGDLDVDFYGGQLPSSGGRTFPLVRLRTARGTIDWTRAQLLFGQDHPLIAELDPVSLASVGVPGFTAAGNLWLWLPQIRGTVHTTGRVRFGAQAAILAPTSGEASGLFDTQFDAAERTGSPYLQAQVRVDWGEDEKAGLITIGVHNGRVADATDTPQRSRAFALSWRVPIGSKLEWRGESFVGEALRGLGGGGISQGIGVNGTPIRTSGGWTQLNVRPTSRWLVGLGGGFDDPEDADVLPGGRTLNTVYEAHAHWRPAGPIVVGLEWRQIATEFTSGARTNRHLNLAFGYEF